VESGYKGEHIKASKFARRDNLSKPRVSSANNVAVVLMN
jgi:hypothetical protein